MTKKTSAVVTVFSGHREEAHILVMFDVLCQRRNLSRNKGINRLIRDAIARDFIPEWQRDPQLAVQMPPKHQEQGSKAPKSYSLDSSSRTGLYRL